MDRSNINRIKRIIDDSSNKIEMLNEKEVEDPWYTGNFDKVYEELLEGIKRIWKDSFKTGIDSHMNLWYNQITIKEVGSMEPNQCSMDQRFCGSPLISQK